MVVFPTIQNVNKGLNQSIDITNNPYDIAGLKTTHANQKSHKRLGSQGLISIGSQKSLNKSNSQQKQLNPLRGSVEYGKQMQTKNQSNHEKKLKMEMRKQNELKEQIKALEKMY